ncbi:SRPBCC family protein [Emticicia fontis]
MTSALLFDFIVDKENRTITIKREFDADLAMVWEAWTNPEILDKWYAPKPYRAETQTMDFREGGFWHYAMINPQGEKQGYSRYDYQKIEPQKNITELRGFSDANGTINPNFARTTATNDFSEADGKTLVKIHAQYGSAETLEFIVKNGFIEGMSACFGNLDELLAGLKK